MASRVFMVVTAFGLGALTWAFIVSLRDANRAMQKRIDAYDPYREIAPDELERLWEES